MKKEERLHRLLGDIDDELVADAARKPIRKAVWVPAAAAAACVTLAVGLWQGGVFDPSLITAKEPDRSDLSEITDDAIEWPSKGNACTPLLKGKMEQYRNTDATFAVIVTLDISYAHYEEFENRYTERNEELLRLNNELWAAYQDYVETWIVHDDSIELDVNPYPEKEAKYYALREQYLKLLNDVYGDVEDIEDELLRGRIEETLLYQEYYDAHVKEHTCRTKNAPEKEQEAASKLRSELEDKVYVFGNEYMDKVEQAREEYNASVIAEQYKALAKLCKTPPKKLSSENARKYYAELTADQINALAEREGYWFRLATADGIDESTPNYNEAILVEDCAE
ncbi:MAG: hypothetical protein IJN82_02330 [Clostridia bacterium]|nr:hypothetical protein [Clostridia bacterium]